MIDLIPGPRDPLGRQVASRFDERPVGFIRPNRALIDPRTQHSNLVVGKALALTASPLPGLAKSLCDELARGTLAGTTSGLPDFPPGTRPVCGPNEGRSFVCQGRGIRNNV